MKSGYNFSMKFYYSQNLSHFTNVLHAFTTKESGNLAFHVGDDPQTVKKNHELLGAKLGYEKEKLVYMKQIHSDLLHVVTDEDFSTPPTCDALVTNKIGVPLMVMVADCSPILFYDPVNKVIAVAHAGRAGAFKNIVKNVIDSFRSFKSNPKDIVAVVGANIGVCCYEVGEEIFQEAKELNLEYAVEKKGSRFYLDINKIVKNQLLLCGLDEKNIEFSDECSCCNTHMLYSYRAEQKTGRFAGIIMLN